MTTTVCAFIKQENNYIDEWLSWHLSIGVDKFILYDNNDGREDYPMTEYVSQQVAAKKVKIFNRRNEHLDKNKEISLLYKQAATDWFVLLSIDEFIVLKNHSSINEWLSEDKFRNADNIRVSMKSFNSAGVTRFDGNFNVRNRFTIENKKDNSFNTKLKTFSRCRNNIYKSIDENGLHGESIMTMYCDGSIMKTSICMTTKRDFSEIEIDAYPTKSLEEYCYIKVGRNKTFDKENISRYKEKYFEMNGQDYEKSMMFDYFISDIYKNEDIEGADSYALFDFGDGQLNGA